MSRVPAITTLLAFEAVARRRSFALAATELHLSASAVSHQITRLEEQLGVRLFERNAHGVRLSAAGERYLARIGGALTAITSATDDLQQGVGNRLYLHSAPSIASLWLLPRLADFARRHPDISLFLSAAHTHSDFALGQADIDLRYGVPMWPGVEIEPLFEEDILPLASPSFAARHGLDDPDRLREVALIQSTVNVVQWSEWFDRFSAVRPPERFPVRFDRAQMALDAATQHLGVALESAVLARRHLDEGRLVAPFGLARSIRVKAHFAVYPARHAQRPAVAAFLDWLRTMSGPASAGS